MTALSASTETDGGRVPIESSTGNGTRTGTRCGIPEWHPRAPLVPAFADAFTLATTEPAYRQPDPRRAGDSTVVSFDTLPMISTLRLPAEIPTVTGNNAEPFRHLRPETAFAAKRLRFGTHDRRGSFRGR